MKSPLPIAAQIDLAADLIARALHGPDPDAALSLLQLWQPGTDWIAHLSRYSKKFRNRHLEQHTLAA